MQVLLAVSHVSELSQQDFPPLQSSFSLAQLCFSHFPPLQLSWSPPMQHGTLSQLSPLLAQFSGWHLSFLQARPWSSQHSLSLLQSPPFAIQAAQHSNTCGHGSSPQELYLVGCDGYMDIYLLENIVIGSCQLKTLRSGGIIARLQGSGKS